MAITASMTRSPTTAKVNQKVAITLTVSNSGAADVEITDISCQSTAADAAVRGLPLGGNDEKTVPAGGSLVITFEAVFFAPGTFSNTIVVFTDDGSVTAATGTNTVVVSAIDY